MDRYASLHADPQGPGDARPTAEFIVDDQGLSGAMNGKVALITGGTAGLGTESARALLKTGMKVFITARTAEKGEKTARELSTEGSKVEVVIVDFSSLDSVRAGAADFLKRSSQLNILMTNAGVMGCPEGRTVDGFETQFGTNHLGHFLLFQLLKPTLLASTTSGFESRVVSVSSAGHRIGGIHPDNYNLKDGIYHPFLAYGQSKTANIYMANEIERRYGSKGLHAWSLHPGVIFETELSRHQDGGPDAVRSTMTASDPEKGKLIRNTGQGASTQVWAAVAKELEGKGGKFLDDCQISWPVPDGTHLFEPGHAPWTYDEGLAKKLWKDSLQMVGLPAEEE